MSRVPIIATRDVLLLRLLHSHLPFNSIDSALYPLHKSISLHRNFELSSNLIQAKPIGSKKTLSLPHNLGEPLKKLDVHTELYEFLGVELVRK